MRRPEITPAGRRERLDNRGEEKQSLDRRKPGAESAGRNSSRDYSRCEACCSTSEKEGRRRDAAAVAGTVGEGDGWKDAALGFGLHEDDDMGVGAGNLKSRFQFCTLS